MIGAVAGDIIGSVYEHSNTNKKEFPLFVEESRFTDDTVLSVAVADSILNKISYTDSLKYWGLRYPDAGYGDRFSIWLSLDSPKPYNSWGNGSAMRVNPVGFAYENIDRVLNEAKVSAEVTHDHHEGIKGAQAVAAAVFLAKTGKNKTFIKEYIERKFSYRLDKQMHKTVRNHRFDISCQRTVPLSIWAFLESVDYEDAVRNAVSLGGDSDTIACITGGIAQAFYGSIPQYIIDNTRSRLTTEILKVIDVFSKRYVNNRESAG